MINLFVKVVESCREDDDEQDDVEMNEVEFQNIHKESALFHLNRCLEILNETPIDFCKTFGVTEKKNQIKKCVFGC